VADADPDPAARAQAIAALVGLRVDGSVDLALAALRDPDWGMRTIVASEIGPTGDPRVVDALLDLLNDTDGYVREAAAIGLDRQGDPRAGCIARCWPTPPQVPRVAFLTPRPKT
jgi:HEAT repeat protein